MNAEDLEACKRFAFDTWGLSNPDPVELFEALRILRIKSEKSVPSYDDFSVAYKRLTSESTGE